MLKYKHGDKKHKDTDKAVPAEDKQADDTKTEPEEGATAYEQEEEYGDEIIDSDEFIADPEEGSLEYYKQKADENYDKYLRALAELENFKKRMIKERAELLKYSGENLARDILIVVDDLERALKNASGGVTENFIEGVKLITGNLVNMLKRHQIVGEESVGKPFDPQKHEAMAMVPTADYEPGIIMEEIKKLYLFKDKVLRIGQVVVAKEE